MSGDDDNQKGPEEEPASETDEQKGDGIDENAEADARDKDADVIDFAAKQMDGGDDGSSEELPNTGPSRDLLLSRFESLVFTAPEPISVRKIARVLSVEGKVVRAASVVLGGVAPNPWRSEPAQNAIEGRELTDSLCGEAAQAAAAECRPMRDNAYKVDLVRTLVNRALTQLASS